ncbi:hypothetical protein L950_0230455 [Sphingobacterium sp. IITKGP-BTPF85]|nr:hypothetical protein L950_0230455 [Sphingobacterium sp. IITKGP-BTPF85]
MNNFHKDGRVYAYLKGIIQSIYTIKKSAVNKGYSLNILLLKKCLKTTLHMQLILILSVNMPYVKVRQTYGMTLVVDQMSKKKYQKD